MGKAQQSPLHIFVYVVVCSHESKDALSAERIQVSSEAKTRNYYSLFSFSSLPYFSSRQHK